MTATKSLRVTPPGGPNITYSYLGALGCSVPAFGLVFTPQLPCRPATFHLLVHKPGESGPAFHARVVSAAHIQSRIDDCPMSYYDLWFTDALPPVEWRRQWQERMRLRWTLMLPTGVAVETRLWAAGRMSEMLGMVPVAHPERQP